jgi:hypothetical protein
MLESIHVDLPLGGLGYFSPKLPRLGIVLALTTSTLVHPREMDFEGEIICSGSKYSPSLYLFMWLTSLWQ